MATRLTPEIVLHPAGHPATRAWSSFSGDARSPEQIHVLKRRKTYGKSAVFRLEFGGTAAESDVIAKESARTDTNVELTVYRDVLPHLSINGPRYIGWQPSLDSEMAWLFLEAIPGPSFDRRSEHHSELAARWLADLHTETAAMRIEAELPHRDLDFYQTRLRATTVELAEVIPNLALTSSDRQVLRQVVAHFESLDAEWGLIDDAWSSLPSTLMHGDFVGKNLGVDRITGRPELKAFDWAEAHWGRLAVDLWAIDTPTYLRALKEQGFAHWLPIVNRAKHIGTVLRMISAVIWELPALHNDWVVRSMKRMSIYKRDLDVSNQPARWHE